MAQETLNIDIHNKSFKAKLIGINFKEGESYIVYIPSLELSGYGDSFKEAHALLKSTLDSFSKDLLALSDIQINKELTRLGWEKNKFFKKRLSHLSETTFDDVKKMFNLPEDTVATRVPIAV